METQTIPAVSKTKMPYKPSPLKRKQTNIHHTRNQQNPTYPHAHSETKPTHPQLTLKQTQPKNKNQPNTQPKKPAHY
jgi:hypothetical protein